ncbi:hypothetical protein FRC14_003301 [Serendipita sp. 396]|nr:hypothetical protein FRC14_003301 [Serendipita sp. 396]KAG8783154.1 hypothetical protein FRC15_005723 [Serendipita sp. 397]KAG8797191.1 hypothetical protein FRC16_009154 [Serendipita sp. 398]KAG8867467.1 hypothetical protein FRC20_005656 [Serendipita sp. 405]
MLGLGPLACRNRVPSHSERLRLRSILGIQSKVVESLDEAIASAEKAFNEACHRCQKLWEEFESAQTEVLSAQKVIEMLRAQKSSLSDELQDLQGLLHPIRRVPDEILAYIFELTIEPRDYVEIIPAMGLSQVCRTWRNVAVNYPPLWTMIQIDLGNYSSGVDCITDTFMDRAGVQPVSLEILHYGDKADKRMYSKLAKISHRVHVVESLNELTFSSYCKLTVDGDDVAIPSLFSVSLGAPLPCIENLSLNSIGGININLKYNLPTLKSLSISGCRRIPLLYVILRCPNLEEVEIQDVQVDTTDLDEEEIELEDKVTRPIRILSVWHGAVLDLVAENIEMPHIESITTHKSILSNPDHLFNNLINLTYLRICDLDLDDWISLVLAAPNLKTLCVGGPSGVEVLANWEVIGLTETPFKKLERLEIYLIESQIDLEPFNTLVRRRCLSEELTQETRDPGTAQLCTIQITCINRWESPTTKSWRDSQYLKYAKMEYGYGLCRVFWPK